MLSCHKQKMMRRWERPLEQDDMLLGPTHLSYNGFILDRIEGAGGVDHAAADLEHVRSVQRDAQLQRVQAIAIRSGPAAPDVRCLAQRSVAAAGHVAQHPVVLVCLALPAMSATQDKYSQRTEREYSTLAASGPSS